MIELYDEVNKIKMKALIICTISYGNNPYIIYAIKRDEENSNIFISKLVKNSQGYTFDHNFKQDEKIALNKIPETIINIEDPELLAKKQINLLTNIPLSYDNNFSSDICYTGTYKTSKLKKYSQKYIPQSHLTKIKLTEEKTSINYTNLILVILGLIVLISCLIITIKLLLK